MLIRADHSLLLVIDLQARLAPAIDGIDAVLAHSAWLLSVAARLSVPALATEQYPAGLGPTVPQIAALLAPDSTLSKLHFSALPDSGLRERAAFARPQVVLIGTETHVCVLQTALDLRALGKEVFVVAEAVGSRRAADRALALDRMRAAGCHVVSREMVAFEWLQRAGTELFRTVSREFLR
ncbi:MAG: hydrolase [Burkholderiaceae bacterium]|jgi:nicotinamidase-related amidase|nr:hydrolase [Burkholderiaceae bacterium]